MVLYFMPFKVSVFLGNEGKGWESDVFHQIDFALVKIQAGRCIRMVGREKIRSYSPQTAEEK